MNKLIVSNIVALMFVSFISQLAIAQNLDYSSYFGRGLPVLDNNIMAIRMTVPTYGLAWAMSQRGKRVGSGQCTDLVAKHLHYSAARPADFRAQRSYVWGGLPSDWVRPGDIIQFEKCIFRYTSPNSWYEVTMDHHTAIIVSANGNVLQLLHQNAPLGGPVKLDSLDLSKRSEGIFMIWRPVAF